MKINLCTRELDTFSVRLAYGKNMLTRLINELRNKIYDIFQTKKKIFAFFIAKTTMTSSIILDRYDYIRIFFNQTH